MLIKDATMQISFLKDLATLRNPTSRFTFLNYLQSKSRLVDFINHKTLFPTRLEFHDYLEWTAGQVAADVDYGVEVQQVRPVEIDGRVEYFDVAGHGPDGPVVRRARNVVLGTGIRARMPQDVERSARVWHSSELLHRLQDAPAGLFAGHRRILVVGAGQSAAEVVAHLHETVPEAEVHAVVSRYGYSPSDDSPLANRVFDPAAVDHFFGAPTAVKQRFFDYHANTNYSVVDMDLIEDLYRREYSEQVSGRRRLRFHPLSRVVQLDDRPDGVEVSVESMADQQTDTLMADIVVFATGYYPMDPAEVLGRSCELFDRMADGRFRVERDYRLASADELPCGVYLQGGTEHSHGISSSLLSTSAVRAGEILQSVVQRAGSGKESVGVRA